MVIPGRTLAPAMGIRSACAITSSCRAIDSPCSDPPQQAGGGRHIATCLLKDALDGGDLRLFQTEGLLRDHGRHAPALRAHWPSSRIESGGDVAITEKAILLERTPRTAYLKSSSMLYRSRRLSGTSSTMFSCFLFRHCFLDCSLLTPARVDGLENVEG